MKNYLIAERYANGLSRAIPDNAELEAATNALGQLSDLYQTNHDLRSVLANPAIALAERAKVLTGVLDAEAPPRMVGRLVHVLLRRGRISVLPDAAEVFSVLVDERLNRVHAVVTTAVPLDEKQQARLKQAMERHSGKAVRLRRLVDPEVLGGVVAQIGNVVIDDSVRSRLKRLKDALLADAGPIAEEK